MLASLPPDADQLNGSAVRWLPERYHKPRLVTVYASDYEAGEEIRRHCHDRAQLVYALTGVLLVSAAGREWTISPAETLLIPPQTEHAIRMLTSVQFRTIYLHPDAAAQLPQTCGVLDVPSTMRDLILHLIIAADQTEPGAPSLGELAQTLLDELKRRTANNGALLAPSLPQHRQLRALCTAFLENPGNRDSVATWAKRYGVSRKTLARAFRRELHMTFGDWQRSVRVEEAKRRIAAGQSVTRAALELGYESLSAFTSMFHRVAGAPPSKYLPGRWASPLTGSRATDRVPTSRAAS